MSYDIKVLASCFKIHIFKESNISIIIEMLKILTHSINFFRERKQAEKNVKNIRKKNTTDKMRHIKMNRNIQYETIVRRINTPFKDVDVEELIK